MKESEGEGGGATETIDMTVNSMLGRGTEREVVERLGKDTTTQTERSCLPSIHEDSSFAVLYASSYSLAC